MVVEVFGHTIVCGPGETIRGHTKPDIRSAWTYRYFRSVKDALAYKEWVEANPYNCARWYHYVLRSAWRLARFFTVRAIPRYHAALHRLLVRAKRLPGVLSAKLFKILALVRVIWRGGNKRSCKG